MDEPQQNQSAIPQEPNMPPILDQSMLIPEPSNNKKPIGSIIFGSYFIFIFALAFASGLYPGISDFIQSNTILALLLWAPLFIGVVFNIVPLMLFLGIIIRRIKGIRTKTENFNWSLSAIILNTIAFALLFGVLLSTGKCIPGNICF